MEGGGGGGYGKGEEEDETEVQIIYQGLWIIVQVKRGYSD